MKHTPTPRYTWHKRRSFTELRVDGEYTGLEVRSGFLERKDMYGHLAERMEVVLRACNAHDEMVAALWQAQHQLLLIKNPSEHVANTILTVIRAIDKAEGR